jgi:hypothetical protein
MNANCVLLCRVRKISLLKQLFFEKATLTKRSGCTNSYVGSVSTPKHPRGEIKGMRISAKNKDRMSFMPI